MVQFQFRSSPPPPPPPLATFLIHIDRSGRQIGVYGRYSSNCNLSLDKTSGKLLPLLLKKVAPSRLSSDLCVIFITNIYDHPKYCARALFSLYIGEEGEGEKTKVTTKYYHNCDL